MGLILLTVIPVLTSALNIFETSSRRSSEDQNLVTSQQKAQEIEMLVMSYIDKMRTIGSLMLTEYNYSMMRSYDSLSGNDRGLDERQGIDIENIYKMDRVLMAVELYTVRNSVPQFLSRSSNEYQWREIGVESTSLDLIKKNNPIPLMKIVRGQNLIQKVMSADKKTSFLAIGSPLAAGPNGEVNSFLISYIKLDYLQRLFAAKGSRALFATNSEGELLVHSLNAYTKADYDFKVHPAIKKALSEPANRRQLKYFHETGQDNYFASYVKSPVGLIFVSEVSESAVLLPVKMAQRKAIYTAGVMTSLIIILVFAFSVSLTIPLEKLVGLTKKIASGDFDIQARKEVKSQDEVGVLAEAFDSMIVGLRERDKVKSLFNKFHGSSVAEEMLTRDEAIRGDSKEVVVFFSDIRGFTAFSEGHSAEEVVEMLNEYFTVMVEIINRNHGVVDKFIGDAIMAVWGAPKSGGDDRYWCVKACLEMRVALEELNESRLARGLNAIMIGMGVHAGKAISGTIGSNQRMEYTVIGDTVNLASRIEASTKAFGTDLLISEDVANSLDTQFFIELAGAAEVKGKKQPLKFYNVLGYIKGGQNIIVETPYSRFITEKADKVKVVA